MQRNHIYGIMEICIYTVLIVSPLVVDGIRYNLSAEEVLVDVYDRLWVVQEKEEGRRCIMGSGTRRARNTQSIKEYLSTIADWCMLKQIQKYFDNNPEADECQFSGEI